MSCLDSTAMKQTSAFLTSPLISSRLVLFYFMLLYLICAISGHLFSCVNSCVVDTGTGVHVDTGIHVILEESQNILT
jgi:low affinity Fe/Cu permease